MKFLANYLKAHAAALGAGLSLLIADLNRGDVTLTDWYGIAGAALGVGVVVGIVPNLTSVAAPVAPAVVLPAQDAPDAPGTTTLLAS